ncbi:MAG: hypothetical protein ACKV2V_30725 [Blastocatellia bacterium]
MSKCGVGDFAGTFVTCRRLFRRSSGAPTGTTAFGLLVALPAVWMFNQFSSRVGGFAIEMQNSASELVEQLFEKP